MKYFTLVLLFLPGCGPSYYNGCATLGMTKSEVELGCGKPDTYYFSGKEEEFSYHDVIPITGGKAIKFIDGKAVAVVPR